MKEIVERFLAYFPVFLCVIYFRWWKGGI